MKSGRLWISCIFSINSVATPNQAPRVPQLSYSAYPRNNPCRQSKPNKS